MLESEEKGSDVNMATHLVHEAHRGQFDLARFITKIRGGPLGASQFASALTDPHGTFHEPEGWQRRTRFRAGTKGTPAGDLLQRAIQQ